MKSGRGPVRLLRPESVTPLAVYLERARAASADAGAAADLAAVLLLREREYIGLQTRMINPKVMEPEDDRVWHPWPLTPDGRRALERSLGIARDEPGTPEPPWDLFGVKPEVAGRLERVLPRDETGDGDRPLLFRLWLDLHRRDQVVAAARGWHDRTPDAIEPLAYLYQAALLSGGEEDLRLAAETERRARPLVRRRKLPAGSWSHRVIEDRDLAAIDRAHTVRRRSEPGFARYLTTERRFYEAERAAALQGFDEDKVPEALRSLIPLARELGVGDDPGRAWFVARMTGAARRRSAEAIRLQSSAIDTWLEGKDPAALSPAEAAFFWLREAGEELGS